MMQCFFNSGYVPNALWNYAYNFDGSTNYLEKTSNLSGISNSSQGVISFFIYSSGSSEYIFDGYDAGGGQSNLIIQNPAGGSYIQLNAANGASSYVVRSNDALTGSAWNHVLISWDTNYGAASKVAHIYINGSSSGNTVIADASGAFSVDYSTIDKWTLGAQASSGGGKISSGRCVGQFYFQPGTLLDFSNSTNRNKFQTSNAPKFIGRQGENPTGTAAMVYLTSSVGNAGLNSGTGGNFDTVHGTFSACGSTP